MTQDDSLDVNQGDVSMVQTSLSNFNDAKSRQKDVQPKMENGNHGTMNGNNVTEEMFYNQSDKRG